MMSTNSAHDVVREDQLESDDEFIYYVDLPTLQEMASYQVCLAIWYSYISPPRYILTSNLRMRDFLPYFGAKGTYQRDIDRLIQGLRAPHRIEEMLKTDVKKILAELAAWADHLVLRLFPDCLREYSLLQIDSGWCVWMVDGEIDYRKSAQKMLDSDTLNDVQKFVVMSKYCMEDEIRTVSFESLPKCFDKVTYTDDCVLFYWICCLKNELHKVRLRDSSSLDISMVLECFEANRMALEYFWRRSLHHEAHSRAHYAVRHCHGARMWSIFERLLILVDSNSSASFCVQDKFVASSMYSKSSRYPLWLWSNFKHLIDEVYFHDVVIQMLSSFPRVDEKMKLLTRIWDTADEHHRDHILSDCGRKLISTLQLLNCRGPPCATALQFLYNCFSLLPVHKRRCILNFRETPGFIINVQDVHFLDQFFELCSVDSQELLELKTRARNYGAESFGLFSILSGNLERMNVTVDWLVSHEGPDAVRALKKKILQFSVHSSFGVRHSCTLLTDFEKWNKLSHFIDETYAEDEQPALRLKKELVHVLIEHSGFELRFRDAFDSVKKIVESVYSCEELQSCKRDLLSDFGDKLRECKYWRDESCCDERFFENFIDWCCGNNQTKISQFKIKVPHDALLTAMLRRLKEHDVYEFQRPVLAGILLDRLQNYLMWYLGSEQSVNEYKLRRINHPSFFTDLKFFMERNKSCLVVILKWFFNGNETSINEFMSKN